TDSPQTSPYNQTPTTVVNSPNNDDSVNNGGSSVPIMVNSPNRTTSAPTPNPVNTPIERRRSLREIMVFDRPTSVTNSRGNVSENTSITTDGGAFRVFVRANNPQEENRVKEIYPDAFRSSYQGNVLWQVGLFSNRQNAEQAAQPLRNIGFNPILSPVN
ncbi:SPOR domain-containing protein, partial [Cyanobacterium stanieri LEGE 03274]|nr:SPOR domain-containing protein [Cyanobacterium stanieri LEGE 03274]